MARTITTSNQTKGGTGYVTVTSDQNGFINLNGGTLGMNDTGETVVKAHIAKIMWGVANTTSAAAYWTVTRGGNTVAVLTGTGVQDFQEENIRLETVGDAISNCSFTLTGGTGTIAVKLHKQ